MEKVLDKICKVCRVLLLAFIPLTLAVKAIGKVVSKASKKIVDITKK